MHYPLLRARKDALHDLAQDMTDEEYDIAVRAIDKFFDFIEEEVPGIADLVINGTKVSELSVDTNCLNCEKLTTGDEVGVAADD